MLVTLTVYQTMFIKHTHLHIPKIHISHTVYCTNLKANNVYDNYLLLHKFTSCTQVHLMYTGPPCTLTIKT